MTTAEASTPVGRIAAEAPAAVDIFEDLGIDYCCGGDRPLADACTAAGVDTADVLRRLADAARRPGGDQSDLADWTAAPVPACCPASSNAPPACGRPTATSPATPSSGSRAPPPPWWPTCSST